VDFLFFFFLPIRGKERVGFDVGSGVFTLGGGKLRRAAQVVGTPIITVTYTEKKTNFRRGALRRFRSRTKQCRN